MASYSGKYKSNAFCCRAVFRIIALLLSIVCLIFCILSMVLPLLTLRNSKGHGLGPKSKSNSILRFNMFHMKATADAADDPDDRDAESYEVITDVTDGSLGLMTATKVLAIIALVASALATIFSIVFISLYCAFQTRRRAADDERKEIYKKAEKRRVGSSSPSSRSSEEMRDVASSRRSAPYVNDDDDVILIRGTPAEAEEINQRLRQLQGAEKVRRRTDQAIGIVLFVMFVILFIASLLAVILFAVFKSDQIEKALETDFRGILSDMDITLPPGIRYVDCSLPFQAGFILLIIVIPLAFVLFILLVVPLIEAFYLCGRAFDIKDKTFRAVENTQSEAPRAPPNTEMPMKKTTEPYPEAAPGPYGEAAYGVPIAQHPGANNNNNNNNNEPDYNPQHYRDLGLPTAAYRSNDNDGTVAPQ